MPSVTIIGGTGGLGLPISEAFLETFRSSFPTVRILTRNLTSDNAKALQAKGAELHKLDDANPGAALDKAFAGVDVIVNALPGGPINDVKLAVVDSLARSDAKVYFLSEYGVDHRLTDFPGYEHVEWATKKELATKTREKVKGKKVIALYTALFLEIAFLAPFLGFDIAGNKFVPYGPSSTKVSFTSRSDIGKAVARLALLALDPATASQVPDQARILGDTGTWEDIRDIVARVKGVEKGTIASEDLAAHKEALRQKPDDFLGFLRVAVGEGKLDFSSDNDNELVNPKNSLWKWKTVEDHIRSSL